MKNAQTLYLEALDLYGKNHLEESVQLLEEALAIDPDHLDALEALGVILGKMERFDEAIEVMKRLVQKTPTAVMPHSNLSIFYMRQGMIEEAENEKAAATSLSFGKPKEKDALEQAADAALKLAEAKRKA